MTDFNDPASRLRLIEEVGPEEYSRRLSAHREASIVETVAGHKIRTIVSARWGTVFMVGETGHGWQTLDAARTYAKENPAT